MQQFTHARGVCGVYVIINTANGCSYIGASADIGERWYHHRGRLRRGVHPNERLQAAWDEFGEDAFDFQIAERVDHLSQVRLREQAWLDEIGSWEIGVGYNRSWTTNGVGWRFSPEQRAKVSAALKGKPKSAAHIAALKARPILDAYREAGRRGGSAGKGKPKSAEHRAKIGAKQQGEANHRAKLTAADVVEMRAALAAGATLFSMALKYGISEGHVSRIKSRKIWTSVA